MKIHDSVASWTHTVRSQCRLLNFLGEKAVKAKREAV
jgi:hypothetical protein